MIKKMSYYLLKVKLILYKKNILKNIDFEDKINILLMFKINPLKILQHTDILTIEKNINDYIIVMENVLKTNLEKNSFPVRKISEHTMYRSTFLDWSVNDEGYITYTDYDYFLKWLLNAKKFRDTIITGKESIDKITYYNNSKKLYPYIINIEDIIGIVFKSTFNTR